MEKVFKPYVINSNICTSEKDISSYDLFMDSIAGNIGNSYITWALLKELGCDVNSIDGHHIKNIYSYDFSMMDKDIDVINNECTHVILVLQDQIRIKESYGYKLPYANIKKFLSKIDKHILVAGLGANSFNGYDSLFYKKLDKELVDFLHFLSEKCELLGLRGDYTNEVLNKLGINNTCVIGCPSYYETGADRMINKPLSTSNIRIGTSNYTGVSGIGPIYLQDQTEKHIIKQICFGEDCSLNMSDLKLLKAGQCRMFSSICDWQQDIKNSIDFYIGCRVHGSMVALNCGVPTVVMNKDSRSREMCEYMNIPYHPEFLNCQDAERIIQACDYSKMNKEYNFKLDIFKNFLEKNGFNYTPLSKQTDNVHLKCNQNVKISFAKQFKAYVSYIRQVPYDSFCRLYAQYKSLKS